MKLISAVILTLILFAQSQAFAVTCETRSAFVRAVITERETDSLTYCRAKISIREFQAHSLCPLVAEDYGVQRGIEFPLENGHDCEIMVGQELNGELISDGINAYIVD
jgi:hypothetical protein